MSVFFQIGTNNGNDLFKKLVIQHKPDIVILVEPNGDLINQIKENYKNIKGVFIFNNAVYYNSNETVELYIPSKNGILGNIADNGIRYHDVHFSLLPMNDWGKKEDMVKISAKTITFDDICKIHNITLIDYLQIDTEGFDSEIIKMIDFSKYTINKIRFEKWNFKPECFTDHTKIANELGSNGLDLVINKLKGMYTLTDINDSDGYDIIATLN